MSQSPMFPKSQDPISRLLLVGHGTRDRQGQQEMLQVAEQLAAACPEYCVEPAFLELARPNIEEAVSRLAAASPSARLDPLIVAPLLLFAAGHAKRDIPAAVRAAISRRGGDCILQAEHLGCEPNLLALSALRYRESLEGRDQIAPEQTLLVMVGRGSRDESATAEMHEFARRRVQATPIAERRVCFVAMAEPGLQATFDSLAAALASGKMSQIRRIVVQPHLLFHGELLGRIQTKVAEIARGTGLEWVTTTHLGPHPLLVAAIRQRVREVASDRST